jgi:hypothetical protein
VATTDLLTDDEARAALKLGPSDPHVEHLANFVTAVSDTLADRVGPIVYGTITGELHDGGCSSIYLRRHPVQSVVQVVEYDEITAGTLTAETNASKPEAGYLLETSSGRLIRRSGNADYPFVRGRSNVYVTYVAGRYANTAAVGERYKAAAVLMLKNAWRAFEHNVASLNEFEVPQAAYPRFAVPNAVKDLLAREWRGVEF